MKRQIKNYKLKRIYPFIFWKKCCKCNQEFKKEYGWKFSLRNRYDVCEAYLCNECAITEAVARDIIENKKYMNLIIAPIGGRVVKTTDKPCPCSPPRQY
ncbi:hypothetical protein [Clostridium botulinum]|uniref:hypothetical protein n=1 Tax=Clostridium botulinum TaxID=1491 RepID=UPI001E3FDD6D|nr:hypothetical protein [Clostridium botulinum]MCD3223965.1 hypothetical protein [Clostridium botulinum C/D]MCD3298178.1 hypothetical protein [Clostridium botulinum C/D]